MEARNNLYPIFLKPKQLTILIVGGGYVAYEKLSFLLKSSPDAKIELVAPMIRDEVKKLITAFEVKITQEVYHKKFLAQKDLVIVATDDFEINKEVYTDCKQYNILVNVADTPELCDFYLGGIVTKGHVKIAISTNGKSPTTAKRLRQFLEEIIPDNINELVTNLNKYRNTIKTTFEEKVKELNKLTESLVN